MFPDCQRAGRRMPRSVRADVNQDCSTAEAREHRAARKGCGNDERGCRSSVRGTSAFGACGSRASHWQRPLRLAAAQPADHRRGPMTNGCRALASRFDRMRFVLSWMVSSVGTTSTDRTPRWAARPRKRSSRGACPLAICRDTSPAGTGLCDDRLLATLPPPSVANAALP